MLLKLIRLIFIDVMLLHILSIVTAPIITIVILGVGTMFTWQQIQDIKEQKKKKTETKQK